LRMEMAGTALPIAKKGDDPVTYTAPFQFMHMGRQYRFDRGEFPVWDELDDTRDMLADPEIVVSDGFYEAVGQLADQVVQAIEEYNEKKYKKNGAATKPRAVRPHPPRVIEKDDTRSILTVVPG
jgi:hypothetical protein